MDNIRTLNGDLMARDLRFAIVAARFNDMIVDSLIRGAVDALLRHGAGEKQLEIIRVPGAYDLPFVVRARRGEQALRRGRGARRGDPRRHAALRPRRRAVRRGPRPRRRRAPACRSAFGVLTTDTIEQAIERAGTKAGNKGADAALCALELANLLRRLEV